MEKEDIIGRVRAGLAKYTHIDLVNNPISFSFEKDALVMEGMVERVSTKRKAVIIAREIMGGIKGRVIDRLRVKPVSRMGDLEIADHLQDILDQEYALEGLPIGIRVGEGIVYLDGEVRSLAHKRLAEVLAWWVPGITDVMNNLNVVPPEKDSDDEITETVKVVLERDQLVKNSNIRVTTKNSVVTLDGLVKSSAAVGAAEDDVWYVPGVNNVVNRLEVG